MTISMTGTDGNEARYHATHRGPFSLYVHIPYCISKCPYCDFNSHVVSLIPEDQYTNALIHELRFYATKAGWGGRWLKSIFFGGGTPSTFKPQSIGRILTEAHSFFPYENDIEITAEANPGTVDSNNFAGYRSCGVNRISIGVQSFDPRRLKFLGRVHSADESRQAMKIIRQSGFDNFNMDLMIALPGQSQPDLQADLDEALSFDPPHLSAYNLTFEEGTPFYRQFRSGKISSLPEDEEIAMAELVESTLAGHGLKRYEISNYARPHRHSRHNVNYWESGDYLGIGAGAHSFQQHVISQTSETSEIGGKRWQNEKDPGRYINRIQDRQDRRDRQQAVVECEEIDLNRAAGEFMFLGLRMTQGISHQTFFSRFGKTVGEFYPKIEDWTKQGWMEEIDNRLRLTEKGLMVANSIFVDFV